MDDNVEKPDETNVQDESNRLYDRYVCSGQVSVPKMTQQQGDLVDLSLYGCRVRFPEVVIFSGDADYDVHLTPPADVFSTTISIIGRPVWSTYEKDATIIGFTLLSSSNTGLLLRWVELLEG
ncbi:MAG: hypothetical protein Ta2A_16710 [Treponemataceae bacterium]|nr:MAG: hypothetical protein Ta2A_16710 [Treponemataceae bacterium]